MTGVEKHKTVQLKKKKKTQICYIFILTIGFHHCSVYTIINYSPITFFSHCTLLLLHLAHCSIWWLDPDYPSGQPDQHLSCVHKFLRSSVRTEPEISELCVKKPWEVPEAAWT